MKEFKVNDSAICIDVNRFETVDNGPCNVEQRREIIKNNSESQQKFDEAFRLYQQNVNKGKGDKFFWELFRYGSFSVVSIQTVLLWIIAILNHKDAPFYSAWGSVRGYCRLDISSGVNSSDSVNSTFIGGISY